MKNNKANESISRYKLLSSYGGPGSLIHTQYGSIIISCINEWGFIQLINKFIKDGNDSDNIEEYVKFQCKNNQLSLSNDIRLMKRLKEKKGLDNLKFLVNIPNIDLDDFYNTIKDDKTKLAINSSFMPKVFFDRGSHYKNYNEWYSVWKHTKDKTIEEFFPPKYITKNNGICYLMQDNIVLICKNGHISDFPWSQYLNWKIDNKHVARNTLIDLFNYNNKCEESKNGEHNLRIISNIGNSSGFGKKILKCMDCGKTVSLEGLMNLKIKCRGEKPWENSVGNVKNYYGTREEIAREECNCLEGMKVALTTGNNIYYSRSLSSIYLPNDLFISDIQFKLEILKSKINIAVKLKDFIKADQLNKEVEKLESEYVDKQEDDNSNNLSEEEYRFEEFNVFVNKISGNYSNKNDLVVKDVTKELSENSFKKYFSKILRLDKIKVTSLELDFSRVIPADLESTDVITKNIFRGNPKSIYSYPVVENYGEGIFFSFNNDLIKDFKSKRIEEYLENLEAHSSFSEKMIKEAKEKGTNLFLVHTFSHLIMKELEFRCGYPTSSLSERIYVSNSKDTKMYGCLIYTTEGAEGSMGGLVAQTRKNNLEDLIKSALIRATICNSDPLCWESKGQGLFDLNLASCFSCSLVSETSCELRNCYLDRRVLVDENNGFFKEILNS